MLLVISSKIAGIDIPLSLFCSELDRRKVDYATLNPHNISSDSALIESKGVIELKIGQRKMVPHVIYMMNQWRCDSIVQIPGSICHTNVYRQRVWQFMTDIRFAFEDAKWFPGQHHLIERADSKPSLFRSANLVGLLTPQFTENSYKPEHFGLLYKKSLGWPFMISYSREKQKEVAVTNTNATVSASEWHSDGFLWQWQPILTAERQVRCFAVGDKVWSVSCSKQGVTDLRQIVQVQNTNLEWSSCNLPREVVVKLHRLMNKLGVSMCAPEFLVTDEGYVLIDLNPCGDWYGFFPDEIQNEIIKTLASIVSE